MLMCLLSSIKYEKHVFLIQRNRCFLCYLVITIDNSSIVLNKKITLVFNFFKMYSTKQGCLLQRKWQCPLLKGLIPSLRRSRRE